MYWKFVLKDKEHISCDCKCKFNSTTWNSNQKWNNKIIVKVKKIMVEVLAHVFVRLVSI